MPVYEYECEFCVCRFDLRQSYSDSPVASCPRCQGRARRVFAPVPVIFKGSGFYVTDHRKDDGKDSGKKDSADTAKSVEKAKEIVSKAKE